MTLVDTSVWIEPLRFGNGRLKRLLQDAQVICHPFIVGEIACGHLRDRARVLHSLSTLPAAEVVEDEEVLRLIETRKLSGRRIGWVDAHLLAATLAHACSLWATDGRLGRVATDLNVAA